mgnify:CR=1 FL=1
MSVHELLDSIARKFAEAIDQEGIRLYWETYGSQGGLIPMTPFSTGEFEDKEDADCKGEANE